jgi:hypothetical protein
MGGGMEQIVIDGKRLDKETEDKLIFITFIIPEFAEAYKMTIAEAYQYLKKYGGLDFLYEHWWALHTDNPPYALDDMLEVCKRNGGEN